MNPSVWLRARRICSASFKNQSTQRLLRTLSLAYPADVLALLQIIAFR
jgi:hypothetical protein